MYKLIDFLDVSSDLSHGELHGGAKCSWIDNMLSPHMLHIQQKILHHGQLQMVVFQTPQAINEQPDFDLPVMRDTILPYSTTISKSTSQQRTEVIQRL